MTTADQTYLFRHAILREAAYQLQPPEERLRLHGLALASFEAVVDGELAEAHSGEIADHAQLAGAGYSAREYHWRTVAFKRARAGYLIPEAELQLRLRLKICADDRQRFDTLHELSAVLEHGDQPQAALRVARECASLADAIGEIGLQADAVKRLAWCVAKSGEMRAAAEMMEPAIQSMRAAGERIRLAGLLSDTALLHRALGNLPLAEKYMLEALELSGDAGGGRGRAIVLMGLGGLEIVRNDHAAALPHLREALQIFRNVGDLPYAAICLGNLGTALSDSDPESARECFLESLELGRRVAYRGPTTTALGGLAGLHLARGEIDEALKLRIEALRIERELDDRQGISMQLGNVGDLHHRVGRLGQAVECFTEALKLAQEVQSPRMIGYWQTSLAIVELDLGQWDAAGRNFAEALPSAEHLSDQRLKGNIMAGQAVIARRNNPPEAERLWSQAQELLAQTAAQADLESMRKRWEAA